MQLVTNLYWNQTGAVRCNKDISEWISIKHGVIQGCVVSPHLFALYTDMIIKEIDSMYGFRIGGTIIHNIRL